MTVAAPARLRHAKAAVMLALLRWWCPRLVLLIGPVIMLSPDLAVAEQGNAAAAKSPALVKVAAIQCSSDLGDVEANRQKLTLLVREAAAGGAKIIVLPEAAITGYVSQDLRRNWHVTGRPLEHSFVGQDPAASAETVPGESTRHFCALARELQVYVTIPLLERSGDLPPPANDDSPPPPIPADKQPRYF